MQGPAQTPLQAFQNAWAERVYARCPPAALARTNRARGCLLRRAALSQPPARARARSTRREPLGRSWVRGVALPDSAATFGRPPAAAVRGPPGRARARASATWRPARTRARPARRAARRGAPSSRSTGRASPARTPSTLPTDSMCALTVRTRTRPAAAPSGLRVPAAERRERRQPWAGRAAAAGLRMAGEPIAARLWCAARCQLVHGAARARMPQRRPAPRQGCLRPRGAASTRRPLRICAARRSQPQPPALRPPSPQRPRRGRRSRRARPPRPRAAPARGHAPQSRALATSSAAATRLQSRPRMLIWAPRGGRAGMASARPARCAPPRRRPARPRQRAPRPLAPAPASGAGAAGVRDAGRHLHARGLAVGPRRPAAVRSAAEVRRAARAEQQSSRACALDAPLGAGACSRPPAWRSTAPRLRPCLRPRAARTRSRAPAL
jgi:hypothetical protein